VASITNNQKHEQGASLPSRSNVVRAGMRRGTSLPESERAMKMKRAMALLVAAALAVCISTAEAAVGSSDWFFVDTRDGELTLAAESANWSSGSITLWCTDADTSGAAHTYSLFYEDESGNLVAVEGTDAVNVSADANGSVHLTDIAFSSRLDGIKPVKYHVKDENGRVSEACETRLRHGLFVGVGHYSEEYQKKCMWYGGGEPLEDLPEVEGNTQRYAELARDNGDFTFTVRPLLGTSATTEKVDAAFIATAETVSPGDVCLFYVATHGGVLSKDNGGLKKGTAVLALYDDDYSEFRLKDGIDLLSARNAAVICILSACQSEALVRQSMANVAVIAAANYQGFSTELFDEIFMEYGWKNGWARNDDALTFGDLADYVRARYNAIFNGITFDNDGELTTRSVQVDNDDLLSKIMVGRWGAHENKEAPVAPTGFGATQASYNDKIRVSWNENPNADLYFVFYGGHACSVYTGYRYTKSTSMWFDDDFMCVKASSANSPVPFEIRAFNGAGVSPSAVTEGWINSRRIVTFDAKGGELGIWQGILPVEGKLYVPYEKGTKLGTLPIPSRNGFTHVCWYTETGLMTVVATADTEVEENVTYYAKWTDMTSEYLSAHPKIAAASGNNIATAAAMTAANGCRTVGECYALGIDPEDPNDDLRITAFRKEDGQPVITVNHTTDGSGNSFADRIRTFGKKSLTDAEWVDVTDTDQSEYHFFKVAVELDDGGSGGNGDDINLDDFVIEQDVLQGYIGEASDVVIPSSVTSIGSYAFAGGTNLVSVTIPDCVTNVGASAFAYCSGLESVVFEGNAPSVGEDAFNGVSGCTVYVKSGSSGWGVTIPGTWNGLPIRYKEDDE